MKPQVITTDSEDATRACGALLGELLQPQDIVLLTGDLGAGKTALTKGIADGLGVGLPVTSPTFNILLVYEGRIPLYHFDLYRLEESLQLEDIDYFATLEADGAAVVEWGDRFPDAAPADGLSVEILIEGDNERRLQVTPIGPRGEVLAAKWAGACRARETLGFGGDGA